MKNITASKDISDTPFVVSFQSFGNSTPAPDLKLPVINLGHLKHLTTQTGILKSAKINKPDPDSGYTLDDNAGALIAMCMHYKLTEDDSDLYYIERYLHFIKNCLQSDGTFVTHLDNENRFTLQNNLVNPDDATGRAVWALGYLVSLMGLVPWEIISEAITLLGKSLVSIRELRSPRAQAYIIKGLYFYRQSVNSPKNLDLIRVFADRMVQMYREESSENQEWFEGSYSYANSILPEAMLYAWLLTSEKEYKDIALSSFGHWLSCTFNENGIKMISNKKGTPESGDGNPYANEEQPLDVASTIMTLSKFYRVFGDKSYKVKMETGFSWFLGNNRLNNTVYDTITGGCHDGLQELHVNQNQGAESTLSYLMARLTMETCRVKENPARTNKYLSGMVLKS